MKQEIIDFRKEIAALEVEQKNTKEQRKTVKFTGERTMSPLEAFWSVKSNREKLRCMYAAYGLMKGKTFYQIENKAKPIDWDEYFIRYGVHPETKYVGKHPLCEYCTLINDYLEQYGYQMPYEEIKKKNWRGEEYTYKDFNPDTCEKIIRIGE